MHANDVGRKQNHPLFVEGQSVSKHKLFSFWSVYTTEALVLPWQ